MHVELNDEVMWVTGGGAGIGRAIALEAARSGARVAVTDLDADALSEVVYSIQEAGGEGFAVVGDVTVPEQMKAAVDQIVEKWGKLTAVCVNAGINGTWAPVDEICVEEWKKTIDINLTGSFLTVHYAVPHLRNAGGGSIAILSSVNGTRVFSNEGASAYASSKAGQLALGQMLALELAPSRIRVNVICPGAFDTGIHAKTEKRDLDEIETPVEFPEGKIPLTHGEMGKPEQVGQLVVFLASKAAGHITGSPVWIDGAESLLQG
ncbi:SDR family oxidoreductase [Rubinisphaera margarita]|uniref:SDR family oxidoreductase n=1 Tax=Rubinisphaera margarita TaxID=2909586 RepID=UPI001EE98B00|nr:SDR family NAD(P)-dependent oxidoreductase [Rubinisphaera margarita]MCG6156463.1 SDR family oxidoreductase [Rubinisphaera margarita]